MKRLIMAALASVLLTSFGLAAAPMPDELVKGTTDQIVELLKVNRAAYEKDHAKLYDMVYTRILPHFDFSVMSRAVLGRHWRDASKEQRSRFAGEFRNLLVRTYATALLKYTDEKVVYFPFNGRPEDKTAVVKTEVKLSGGGPPVPIQYSFYQGRDGWKVYDVTIDGVSLVTNYQSTYAAKIRSDGIDALIANMAPTPDKASAVSTNARGAGTAK